MNYPINARHAASGFLQCFKAACPVVVLWPKRYDITCNKYHDVIMSTCLPTDEQGCEGEDITNDESLPSLPPCYYRFVAVADPIF